MKKRSYGVTFCTYSTEEPRSFLMKRILFLAFAFVVAFLLSACIFWREPEASAEKFTVNNVYGDHMVLQRHKPIQIVGTAEAGKAVKVVIGENSVVAVAGKDGVWKAVLPAMEAGGPYTVTVSGAEGSSEIVFNDVLIGEVWLCSGQSNMEMPGAGRRFWCSKNGRAEAAGANFPQIRIFQVTNIFSPGEEQVKCRTVKGWEVCAPETIGKFSACGFYFGRALYKDLNIPIGLIDAAWSGTRIQPWISKAGYTAGKRAEELSLIDMAEENKKLKDSKKTASRANSMILNWLNKFYDSYSAETAGAIDWMRPELDTANWKKVQVPGTFAELGVVWFRRCVDIPAAWAGKNITLSLGAIDDLDETYFNGQKIGGTGILVPEYWLKKRRYTIPGNLVKAGKNVIAVRVTNINGAGGICASARQLFLGHGGAEIPLAGTWLTRREFAANPKKIAALPTLLKFHLNSNQYPANLYNGMIHPWTVYPMRGFVWYQGCSNAGNAREYMVLHPLLIQDWRNRWNDQNMPFIFAQLAAYEKHTPRKRLSDAYLKKLPPLDSNYAALREVQTATLNVPLTGMGVAIDIGDHSDIHPANKQDLAYRMAQEAKRLVYGYKGITAGPMFKAMKIEGDKIRISYTNVGKGLKVKGDKLNCFAIAGKAGKFVWANAKIEGDTVVVWADTVKQPVNVRYAWANFPVEPNLYNQEEFPACPFRTDMPDYLLKIKTNKEKK